MPYKDGRLTPREKKFAEHFADSNDLRYSAEKAGFALSGIESNGWRALQRPEVQAVIRAQQSARLVSEALPAAVNCLVNILKDGKAAAGARVSAAKVVLDRVYGVDATGERKDPSEMSAEELGRAIEKLQQEASERAKIIEGDVNAHSAPDPGLFG